MTEYNNIGQQVLELIGKCENHTSFELISSNEYADLIEILGNIEPDNAEDIAEIFYQQIATVGPDATWRHEAKVRVLLLSLVEKMEFPVPTGAQGSHYWQDKCATELVDLGHCFIDEDEPEDIKHSLELIREGRVSEFALIYCFQTLWSFSDDQMKELLKAQEWHMPWLGAFANSTFATKENTGWLVANFPNYELEDLVRFIQEISVCYSHWEFPFEYFVYEEQVTDNVIEYVIEVLENGYSFKNEKEKYLAKAFLGWEDDLEVFLERATELCADNSDLTSIAKNSSLDALAQAIEAD